MSKICEICEKKIGNNENYLIVKEKFYHPKCWDDEFEK